MDQGNLFSDIPETVSQEIFERLLSSEHFRLERIVSRGQATPPGTWFDEGSNEWVLLLMGAARLRFEDDPEVREMAPGDFVHIPAHRRHRVEWTSPDKATVWLALHYR